MGLEPNQVAISGSSGLIGTALGDRLGDAGVTVKRIVRGQAQADRKADQTVVWDQQADALEAQPLEGVDAVVHLAGESLIGCWTRAKRQRIRDSRVHGTARVCHTLGGLDRKPRVLVCASAVGIYGDRGDAWLSEQSLPGDAGAGFLREVCEQWEQATAPAREAGIRVVNLRIGALVLSRVGGALAWMVPAFKAGLGGVLGSGDQWMTWITLDELVEVIVHCMADQTLSGPVNAMSPQALTNRQFTRTLGHILGRPTLFPAPALVLKAALGDLAREMLLASSRVHPAKLEQSQYAFRYTELDAALRSLIS